MTTHPDTTALLGDAELAEAIATATTSRTLTAILRRLGHITYMVMLGALAVALLGLVADLDWLTGPAGTAILAAFALTFAAGVLAAMLDDAPDPDDHDAVAAWWITGTRPQASRR
ncbi:hypothetical protein GCM10027059_01860 [Myceligenerans halotolerans]